MFSYRHAFHAGNHADVLKHLVLLQIIRYMAQKDTPYTYVDTHAGAGLYALDGNFASKTAEYETGIAKLWTRQDLPPALQEYIDLIADLNPSGKLRYYPGSPFCAEKLLREEDRLRLFELHGAESKILLENFNKLEAHQRAQGKRQTVRGKRVMIHREDGFGALKALLPPPSRRALVLIDPPYEDKNDYRHVKNTLEDALKRFPSGTYAVWYPILQRPESRQFIVNLKKLHGIEWLNVSLAISAPLPDGLGLHNSGMFIINPPWKLAEQLKSVMPYLVAALGVDAGAQFVLESGTTTAPRPRRVLGAEPEAD